TEIYTRSLHDALPISQAVGIVVAIRPDDLVGQRFACQEEALLVLGVVGHRQPDMRQEGAGQHIDLVTGEQFFSRAYRIAGIGIRSEEHTSELQSRENL